MHISFGIPIELYENILSKLSFTDISALRATNSELNRIVKNEQFRIIRKIHEKVVERELVFGLTDKQIFFEYPILKKILSNFQNIFLDKYIICFYKGKTITIENELIPHESFELIGIYIHYKSRRSTIFKIKGKFITKEQYLYPKLDSELIYEEFTFFEEDGEDDNIFYLFKEIKNIFIKNLFTDSYFSYVDEESLIDLYQTILNFDFINEINGPNGINIKYEMIRYKFDFGNKINSIFYHFIFGSTKLMISRYQNNQLYFSLEKRFDEDYEINFNVLNEDYEKILSIVVDYDINIYGTLKIGNISKIFSNEKNKYIYENMISYYRKITEIYNEKNILINPIVNDIQIKGIWLLDSIEKISENKIIN